MHGPRAHSIAVASVLAVATVAILLACGTGTRGSPATIASGAATASPASASPPASALPSAAGTVFESQRYGYRLVYPPGWSATETPGSGGVHPDEPGVDTFRDPGGHILSVVREPAPSLTGWTCAIALHLQGEHQLSLEASEDIVVAGVPARLLTYHLIIKPYVIHYLTVELVHQGAGLTLSLESTTGDDGGDRAILDSLLAQLALIA